MEEYRIIPGTVVPCVGENPEPPPGFNRGIHDFERQVRPHPWLWWLGFKQDRSVCRRCKGVIFPWDGRFKPNPQLR